MVVLSPHLYPFANLGLTVIDTRATKPNLEGLQLTGGLDRKGIILFSG